MAINELKLEWSVWCAASLGDEYLEQIEEKHKPTDSDDSSDNRDSLAAKYSVEKQ